MTYLYVLLWLVGAPLLLWLSDAPWSKRYKRAQRLLREEERIDRQTWAWAVERRRKREAAEEMDRVVAELCGRGL